MKRLLKILLSLSLILIFVPAVAFAEGEDTGMPESVKISGTLGQTYVGIKELDLSEVQQKGNKIIVTYEDGSTDTYKCIEYKSGKNKKQGFYLNGDKNADELCGNAEIRKGIKKGKNSVVFKVSFGEYKDIPMKTTVKATKLAAFPVSETYLYTGRKVYPKIVVKDGNGKKIPAKAYTVKYYNPKTDNFVKDPFGTKLGHYSYKVVFKKAYLKKYVSEALGDYVIGPEETFITKATVGKKRITLKWEKKSSGISGYVVQYSTYKDFRDLKEIRVKKSKNYLAIEKGLSSNKNYYFRVCTYKTYKGEKVYSKPSQTLRFKVK